MSTGQGDAETVEEEEVRPGLVMVKRRIRKEDGRPLIFFDFVRHGGGKGSPASPKSE